MGLFLNFLETVTPWMRRLLDMPPMPMQSTVPEIRSEIPLYIPSHWAACIRDAGLRPPAPAAPVPSAAASAAISPPPLPLAHDGTGNGRGMEAVLPVRQRQAVAAAAESVMMGQRRFECDLLAFDETFNDDVGGARGRDGGGSGSGPRGGSPYGGGSGGGGIATVATRNAGDGGGGGGWIE